MNSFVETWIVESLYEGRMPNFSIPSHSICYLAFHCGSYARIQYVYIPSHLGKTRAQSFYSSIFHQWWEKTGAKWMLSWESFWAECVSIEMHCCQIRAIIFGENHMWKRKCIGSLTRCFLPCQEQDLLLLLYPAFYFFFPSIQLFIHMQYSANKSFSRLKSWLFYKFKTCLCPYFTPSCSFPSCFRSSPSSMDFFLLLISAAAQGRSFFPSKAAVASSCNPAPEPDGFLQKKHYYCCTLYQEPTSSSSAVH